MDCPVCKKPLIVVERNKIELDYCIECKGIWFDQGELNLLAEILNFKGGIPDVYQFEIAGTSEKPCPCPRCNKKMEKFNLPQMEELILDRCINGHGVWFDSGELGEFIDKYALTDNIEDNTVLSFLGEVFHPRKLVRKEY